MSIRRRARCAILSLTLAVSLFLVSCAPAPSDTSYEEYHAGQSQDDTAFDRLSEDLFRSEVSSDLITLHYTLADPSAFGITVYPCTFGTFSTDSSDQIEAILASLGNISQENLSKDRALTYRILENYLTTRSLASGLELYEQPLSSTIGIQAQLPILLSEYAFYREQDVRDYLLLLTDIDRYYGEILEFEQQKAAAGLAPCDTVIDRLLDSCKVYVTQAGNEFLKETFAKRLEGVDGISDADRTAYISQNEQVLNEHFVPAYEKLCAGLESLRGKGTNAKGLFYFPQGKAYYEYLVQSKIGPSYPTIEELKNAVGQQMFSDLQEMNALLSSDPSLSEQAKNFRFSLNDPTEILEDLKRKSQADFPPIDECVYEVKDVPTALEPYLSPAFYLTVPLDRPKDNSIYINHGSSAGEDSLYATLAHEGYPGHMYQTQYFNAHNSSNLRKLLSFTSYNEGWATYVEQLSYQMADGVNPNLATLLARNSSFTLGLYALLDIQIHYAGWDLAQTKEYLNSYFQIDDLSVISTIFYDVAENPANYLQYYVGSLEIKNLRRAAETALGEAFSPKDFHTFLLSVGPAPFSIIWEMFREWVKTAH